MKKTLIALMAAATCAMGETSFFTDLSQTTSITLNGIKYDSGSFTGGINLGKSGTTNYAGITIAFTLNLTEALNTSSTKSLINIVGNTAAVGMQVLTDDTAQGTWKGGGDGNARMDLEGLKSHAYSLDGVNYVTLTLTATQPNQNGGNGNGFQIYTNDGSNVFSHINLGTTNNTSFNSVTINKDLITSVAISPGVSTILTGGEDSFTSAAIGRELQGMVIPEPATATLSLLALAGLAARRRRH
ncbi:MAG: hypothetical protein IKY91_02065 [Akkermansia sp.]|nr:hypothetical protein [Akkermansia sp.]